MSQEIAQLQDIADNDEMYRRLSINSHINPNTRQVRLVLLLLSEIKNQKTASLLTLQG